MKFSQPDADVLVPAAGETPAAALARVTHLCIAAHQDDIEIMAYAGIAACRETPGQAFGGVVVTDGAGAPRSGRFASYTDGEMKAVRRDEQRRAAEIGRYAIQIQLAHPSAEVKRPQSPAVRADLAQIFSAGRPATVYLHNPADKHDTHVALFLRSLEALRALPPARRPARVLGCEVWRDLDWLVEADKVALNSGANALLAGELLKVFASQIAGGKRYDVATLGRRAANATFHTSHATDRLAGITWAMDLTPLVRDPALAVEAFVAAHIDRLREEVTQRLRALG